MPVVSPFPLNIAEKQDSWEKEQLLLNIADTLKVPASEFNKIIKALEYLNNNQSVGGYIGNIGSTFKKINIDFSSSGSEYIKVREAINALPNYILNNGSIQWFYTQRIVITNGDGFSISNDTGISYAVISEYYLLQKKIPEANGKISVGVGGTELTSNELIKLFIKDTRSFEPTKHELGDIGTDEIWEAVNTSGPYSTPNSATITFEATQGGELKLWLYLGTQEEVGLGSFEGLTSADFRLFPSDESEVDPPPAYQETLPQSLLYGSISTIFELDNHECRFYYMNDAYFQDTFKTRKIKVGGKIQALIDTTGETEFPRIENKWLLSIPETTLAPTGTATVSIDSDDYVITYTDDIATTLQNFVTDNAADILSNNELSVILNEENKLEFDGDVLPTISVSNTTGTLTPILDEINALMINTGAFIAAKEYDLFVEEQLDNTDSIWKICSWHYDMNIMQKYLTSNENEWEIYDACKNGGAIIANAHKHFYSRTKTLIDIPHQVVDPEWTNPDKVRVKEGATFVFISGLGGGGIHSENTGISGGLFTTRDSWGSIYTTDQDATHGALFCTFNSPEQLNKAFCYFKNIDGKIIDEFTVTNFVSTDISN